MRLRASLSLFVSSFALRAVALTTFSTRTLLTHRSQSFRSVLTHNRKMSSFVTEQKVKAHDALDEASSTGKFLRTAAGYREIISPDHPVFKPAANRYHLYISYACPWANRCLAILYLKGLEGVIGFTAVHPTWQRSRPNDNDDQHKGWTFFDSEHDAPLKSSAGYGSFAPSGCEPDRLNDAKFVRDLYELSNDTLGKYSVPVLWDTETKQIVNNESSEIIRMFNSQFDAFANKDSAHPYANHDFYPLALREAIDAANAWIYPSINDGVYKCGFARSQAAYDEAVTELFAALARVESILATQRYIVSNDTVTEADIRLFMTLVRFDEVYVVYFKTNVTSLQTGYPNIRQYLRDIYQLPMMNQAVNMEHIKMHYFTAHPVLNPYSIIPRGPNVLGDLILPHDRAEKFAK